MNKGDTTMPIRHKGTALLGVVLGISFLAMQTFAFAPVFGGRTGLEFSDDLFNSLAKGSSYFVPQLSSRVKRVEGQEVAASVRMGSADQAARALKVFSQAAPDTTAQGAVLSVKGDLGKLLGAALGDSRAMYSNNAGDLRARYGADGGAVMVTWAPAMTAPEGSLTVPRMPPVCARATVVRQKRHTRAPKTRSKYFIRSPPGSSREKINPFHRLRGCRNLTIIRQP
jgi:hypothetical protein